MNDSDAIEQLLIDWETAREKGILLSPEELCQHAPHLLSQIRPQLAALQHMYGMLDQHQGNDEQDRHVHAWPGIPGYEFVSNLGAGGMGVVFKARDLTLGRDVAIKTLGGQTIGEDRYKRFRTEAEAVAQLKHPGIVQVYGFGNHREQPYIVMEYIDGFSLRHKLNGSPIKPRIAAQLVEIIARAIHAAHEKGIIHRDLKPANILLHSNINHAPRSPGAKTIAGDSTLDASEPLPQWEDFQVKIADFGIAKRLDDQISATITGEVMGTPNYMAPEQAAGSPDAIGPHTDIHAIGAILYELLTGHPPFAAPSVLETLQLVKEKLPVDPRRLQPGIPADLATICLKCLEKLPENRYLTADQLADDLERFISGKSITARPAGNFEKAWRWCKRNPVVACMSAALLIAVTIGVVGIIWNWQHALQSNKRAEASLVKARKAIDEYFTLVSEETLLDEPGFQDLREKLLTSALSYYEQLIAENSNAPELADDLADAHAKVAHISAVVGKLEKSRKHYLLALGLFGSPQKHKRDDKDRQIAAVKTRGQYAVVLFRSGMEKKAKVQAEQVVESCTNLKRPTTKQQEITTIRLNALRLLGVLHENVGDVRSSELAFESALKLAKELIEKNPDDQNIRLLYARTNQSLGQLCYRNGKWDQAQTHYQDALVEIDNAAGKSTNQFSVVHTKAIILNDLGNLMMTKGLFSEAGEHYRDGQTLVTDLVRLNPKVLEYKNLLGVLLHNMGHAGIQSSQFVQAAEYLDQALALRKSLIDTHHQSHAIESDYANTLNSLAVVATETGDLSQAEQYYQQAYATLKKLTADFPEITDYQNRIAMVLGNLNTTRLHQGKMTEIVTSQQQAIAITEFLLNQRTPSPAYLRTNINAKILMAEIYFAIGQTADAEKMIAGITISPSTSDSTFSNSIDLNRKMTISLCELSELQYQTGKLGPAIETIQSAVGLAQKNTEDFPQSIDCKHTLAKCFLQFAKLQINSNDLDEASVNLDQAFTINSELTDEHPETIAYRTTEALIYFSQAQLDAKQRKSSQSIENSKQCISLLNDLLEKSPGRIKFKQLIAKAETNLGNTYYESGNNEKALEYLQSSAQRWELLSEKQTQSDEANTYYAICLLNLGNVNRRQSRIDQAITAYSQSLELSHGVLLNQPRDRTAKTCLCYASWGRARCNNNLQKYAAAAKDWQCALDHGNETNDLLFRMEKAWSLSKSGQHQDAFAEAKGLAQRHSDGNAVFIAARLAGQAINALQLDQQIADTSKIQLLEQYQNQTMEWLIAAKELDVFDSPQMRSLLKTHLDFAGIRKHEPFQSFAAALD